MGYARLSPCSYRKSVAGVVVGKIVVKLNIGKNSGGFSRGRETVPIAVVNKIIVNTILNMLQ